MVPDFTNPSGDNADTRPNRRSIRVEGYDYSSAGAYFVTVCVHDHQCLLGRIVNDEMELNTIGRLVDEVWGDVDQYYDSVSIGEKVVMPNHVHAIVWIDESDDIHETGGETPPLQPTYTSDPVGARSPRPGDDESSQARAHYEPTLGQIIGYFKYQSTKQINLLHNTPGERLWQRNFYERIIRDEDELFAARHYIRDNPKQWALDKENPDNVIA